MFLDQTMLQLLQDTSTIAIVGAKDKAGQPVDDVGRYLLRAGYTLYPVHPVRATVWGLPAYKSLADLPQPVDIINLFRASQHCPAHAREVLELPWKPLCFWMQQGIRSVEAGTLMAEAGVRVVEDSCIKTEHQRLCGEGWRAKTPPVFSCQMCGQCCEGKGGIVVSPTDLPRLCQHLGIDAETFCRDYGDRHNGKLKVRCGEDGNCIFFVQGKGCGVHVAKPDICRAWPFFHGNMVDALSLHMAKDFCPGIRKDADHASFVAEGLRVLEAEGLCAHDAACEAHALLPISKP